MKWLVLAFLLMGEEEAAQQRTRPRCAEQTQGYFWPEEANHDRQALRQAVRCGTLQVCSRGFWRYRWQPVSTPYWRLSGAPVPADCADADAAALKIQTAGPTESAVPDPTN
jgi:hypothetical protein